MSKASDDARKALTPQTVTGNGTPPGSDFLSTGVTPLNLACTNRVYGGLQKGSIYRLIGKSQTSKTMLARTILAEAARNAFFKDYTLSHNDVERGCRMPASLFGQALAKRLRLPQDDDPDPTLLGWYQRMLAAFDKGQKLIEVVDSFDAMHEPTAEDGGWTDGKPKVHSQNLRKLMAGLTATGSIIILIQHAKVNLGNTWAELVTTGGASPEFYSTLDVWLSKCETLKVEHDGNKYATGVMIDAHVRKNRTVGYDCSVRFPLYYEYGIDDVGACIWYLRDSGHWKAPSKKDKKDEPDEEYRDDQDSKGDKKKRQSGRLYAPEFEFTGTHRELVQLVEEKNLQPELRKLCGKVWNDIRLAISQKRKPRYT